MVGFWLVNLIIPSHPEEFVISAPSGDWTISKNSNFQEAFEAIKNNQCAHTYSIENDASMDNGAAICETSSKEMTPILLGMSYLSGLSVTVKQSLPHSDITIIQPTSYWPRERAIGQGNPCINNEAEFVSLLNNFIAAWPVHAQAEKVLILIHHWLDALACWSFEDFYLSATTLLQIIAATEVSITGHDMSYFSAIQSASARTEITPLNRDFKDMRNNLIHEGKLLGGKFSGANLDDCASVAKDVMNWFDRYIHSVLNLGPVIKNRYSDFDYQALNAYSV